jgi:predicted glycoside hydrolase/deacetylase ChbG (UPF0249 family)
MRLEMRAQFERFVSTGLPFSHVDGHNHLHMHPVIFDALIELCEEFGVKSLRIVKGEVRLSLKLDRKRLPIKIVSGVVFNMLGRRCATKLKGRRFVQPQKVFGLLQTGGINEDYLLNLLKKMGNASSEIYAHPLAFDAGEGAKRENPGGPRELQALLSARVQEAIETAGFRLATYKDL